MTAGCPILNQWVMTGIDDNYLGGSALQLAVQKICKSGIKNMELQLISILKWLTLQTFHIKLQQTCFDHRYHPPDRLEIFTFASHNPIELNRITRSQLATSLDGLVTRRLVNR